MFTPEQLSTLRSQFAATASANASAMRAMHGAGSRRTRPVRDARGRFVKAS